jgi:phosphoglycerol transferase MdoB-like AlkP superfamily enzyme
MLRKIITAIFLALFPGGFIFATTSASELLHHTEHIVLFSLFGMLLAYFYLRKEIHTKKKSFMPSLRAIMLGMVFLFISIHAMPCQYMMTSQTAQTMIAHPCSQPATPGLISLSFIPVIAQANVVTIASPVVHVLTQIQIPPNKAPPFV